MTTVNKKQKNQYQQNRPSSKQSPFPCSIRQAEERPELNHYVTGKALALKAEQPVLKPSLAEHLYNPYIYIKKVLNKQRAVIHVSEHPEDWNTSCNVNSWKRPVTRGGGHSEIERESSPQEREKSQSPEGRSESPRLTSKADRQEKYEENANLRTFVYDFFEKLYNSLLQRQIRRENQRKDEPESAKSREQEDLEAPEDLRERFAKFAKEKKVAFNKKDEDKYVTEKTFEDFIRYILGVDKKEPEKVNRRLYDEPKEPVITPEQKQFDALDIPRFFRSFAENRGNNTNKDYRITMKAFMFNYKKYVTNKYKIRYILSEKSSKQRNTDMKIYVRDFLASFDMIRSYLSQIKEKERNISSALYAYDMAGRPDQGIPLMMPFDDLSDEKDRLIFERKVLVRFLDLRNKKYPETLVDLDSLRNLIQNVFREEKSADLTLLGNFIHDFKREKQLFKEDQFNTFEMVNFIQEKRYSRAQFDVISYFIACLRKAYNRSRNLPKEEYVDPRTPIANAMLSSTFERLCKKAEMQNLILDRLVATLEEEYEKHKGAEATIRTNRIIEHNVIGDFILKKFNVLDTSLLSVLDKFEELGSYLARDDIDHLPMEEIRERVYFILTGSELKEKSRTTKKLEGFTNLLKGKDPVARRLEQEEPKFQSRDIKETPEDRRQRDTKAHQDDDDDYIRILNGDRIDREKEKEKQQKKKDDDDWDWQGAMGGKPAKPEKVTKDVKDLKESIVEDETDRFIELFNPKKRDGDKWKVQIDPKFIQDPREIREAEVDNYLKAKQQKSFEAHHAKDPRQEDIENYLRARQQKESGVKDRETRDPRAEEIDEYLKQRQQKSFEAHYAKDPRQEDIENYLKQRQHKDFEAAKYGKEPAREDIEHYLRQRQQGSESKYGKEPNREEVEHYLRQRQQGSESKYGKEPAREDIEHYLRQKQQGSESKYGREPARDDVENYLRQRQQGSESKYGREPARDDVENYLRQIQQGSESKYGREPARDDVENYLRQKQQGSESKYGREPARDDVENYLRQRQQGPESKYGKEPTREEVEHYLRQRQQGSESKYGKEPAREDIENYLRQRQQGSESKYGKEPTREEVEHYLRQRQQGSESKYGKEPAREDIENYLRQKQQGSESKYGKEPTREEIEHYLRQRQQGSESKYGKEPARDDVENYLRQRQLGSESKYGPKDNAEDYLLTRQQRDLKDRERELNARLDARGAQEYRGPIVDNYLPVPQAQYPNQPSGELGGYPKHLSGLIGGQSATLSDKYNLRDDNSSFRATFLDTFKSSKPEGFKASSYMDGSPEKERLMQSLLEKNEKLCKQLDECTDPNYLTKSTLKGRTDDAVVIPETVNLGRDKPKMGRFSDYEVLMPSDYYAFIAKKNVEMDKDPWYIRSHHIETLTEHPKSVKDNLLGAEYISYYNSLPKDQKLVAKEKEIVGYGDKESLIQSLEENRSRLKQELDSRLVQRNQRKDMLGASGFKDSKGLKEVSKYYDTREIKQGPELMVKAYEGILDDLRNQEKSLLNQKRTEELSKLKPPPNKWWELKDKTFIDEYIKHVFMHTSDPMDVQEYLRRVEELQIEELI